jgi:hypothetical protein
MDTYVSYFYQGILFLIVLGTLLPTLYYFRKSITKSEARTYCRSTWKASKDANVLRSENVRIYLSAPQGGEVTTLLFFTSHEQYDLVKEIKKGDYIVFEFEEDSGDSSPFEVTSYLRVVMRSPPIQRYRL